jgi:nicotinate-nucleotide adenylyltransferase
MRIGVYGGTFDPLHIGHLAVVEAVREEANLDRVLFVPNNRQPLKSEGPFAGGEQRLRMVLAAVADNPSFSVSDVELRHPGPSYTIDTLDRLRAELPGVELCFIVGVDAAQGLARWREPVRIIADYGLIVMSRAEWPVPDWAPLERVHPDARAHVQLVQVPNLAIASSEVRQRLEAGRSVRYLVPDPVIAIIRREGLYGVRGGNAAPGSDAPTTE